MTALADIGNRRGVSKAMTVAALRGSDLEEFNEAHPRDAVGRFARVAESPSKEDPRIARMARLRRRQRRGAAEIAGHQAAVAQAATDASALQGLRRERVLPPRRMPKVADPRVKAKQETPKETKPEPKVKPHLNDESKARPDEMYKIKTPAYVVVDREQAIEFMLDKSLVVGAANNRWGTDLKAFDWTSLTKHIHSNDLRGKVILEITNDWYTPEGESQLDGVLLSSAQYLSMDLHTPKDLSKIHQKAFLTGKGDVIHMPVIPVNADDFDEATYTLRQHPNYRKQPTSKAASAMEWDDADHPRDPDTGQFMRLHTGPGGPPSNPDPRISRERRRRRRQRRGLAEMAEAHREPEQREPEPRTLADVRARAHRPAAHRPAQVLMEGRVGLRQQDSGSPRELPLTRPQEKPQEETLGPRIHPWVGISPDVSTLAPVAPRVPKSKARNRQSYKLPRLRETAALGAVPRMDLVDEYGNHLNQADIDAWVAAVRARRARKARAARS